MKKIIKPKFKVGDRVVYIRNGYKQLTKNNTYTVSYVLECVRPVQDHITLKEMGDFDDLFYIKDFISVSEYRKMKLIKLLEYEH